jgi:hypothetical protein
VPRDAKVTVDASNGGINVSDVRGSVEAETINGGLFLNDVSGDIRGRVVNGGVVVQLSNNRWQGAVSTSLSPPRGCSTGVMSCGQRSGLAARPFASPPLTEAFGSAGGSFKNTIPEASCSISQKQVSEYSSSGRRRRSLRAPARRLRATLAEKA